MMSVNKICSATALRSIVSKHGYASQAAPQKIDNVLTQQSTKSSKLPNGLTVVSVENYSPVSKISVVVKAGSRYESNNALGVTHTLRNMAGYATKNSSGFGIVRNIEQIGANIQTTASREHMTYTLSCIRDKTDVGIKFLSEMVSRPLFKPWEIDGIKHKMEYDLAIKDECPTTVLMEMLHAAAFRRGLGNSLYAPDYMLGKFTPDMLSAFVTSNYTSDNIAIVGSGIDHDQLIAYANQAFEFQITQEPSFTPSGYHGGELRSDGLGQLAFAAVVTEGASLKTLKDRLCLAVLQQALGTGPHIKWSSKDAGRLAKSALKTTESPHMVSSININYSDSGLFGFIVASQASEMDKVLKSAVEATSGVTKNGLTDQEVKTAKKQLKAAMHFGLENSENTHEEMAMIAFNENHESLDSINATIDNLTTQEIMTVAKKVITGKPSMAAIGNLSNTPYLDQL